MWLKVVDKYKNMLLWPDILKYIGLIFNLFQKE